MKKFFVALFLIVSIITVHLFVSDIIYLQIADLLWLFVYGIGLSKLTSENSWTEETGCVWEKCLGTESCSDWCR